MSKGTGAWGVWSIWLAGRVVEMAEVHTTAADEAAAIRDGLQLCCLAGTRLVEVVRPDGSVAGRWSRTDNRWITYPHDTSEEEFQRLLTEDCG